MVYRRENSGQTVFDILRHHVHSLGAKLA